jgi:hypothetical protein
MKETLSKKEKAALRELIDKGLQASYTNALEEAAAIIQHWHQGNSSNREAYSALFECVRDNDKFIARRYDNMRGSRYVITVIGIYQDKQISDEDLLLLPEELREYIKGVGNSL